jgi:hypothetical protein
VEDGLSLGTKLTVDVVPRGRLAQTLESPMSNADKIGTLATLRGGST